MASQKKVAAKLKQQIDTLFNDEESTFTIITTEKLKEIIEVSTTVQTELITEISNNNKKLITSLNSGFEKLSKVIKDSSDTTTTNHTQLIEKIEQLTCSMKSTNEVIETPQISLLNSQIYFSNLEERNKKYQQAFRAQHLTDYYSTIISQENVFIPPKFRPKIYENTPEYVKEIKKQHATENVNREITILQSELTEFQNKIKEFDQKNNLLICSLTNDDNEKEIIKSNYLSERQKEEEEIRNRWLSNFDKMKENHQKEIERGSQCILKIQPSTEHQNFRHTGQYQNNNRYKSRRKYPN